MSYDPRTKTYTPDPAASATDRQLEDIRARFSRLNPNRDRKAEGKKLAADRDAVSAAAAAEQLDRDLNGWAEEHPGRRHRDRILQGRGLAAVEWAAHREGDVPERNASSSISPVDQALQDFHRSDADRMRDRVEFPAWNNIENGE